MKHQVSFLGGQLLPIYIGIKEFMPDKIYCIASEESKAGIVIIKGLFKSLKFSEFICDPFDFYSVKKRLNEIICKVDANDEILINLTGGTKIMLLAAQSVITDKQVRGFYIDQDYTLIEIPSYSKKLINSQLLIKDFFSLSGHKIFTAKALCDFTDSDFKVSNEIESFAASNKFFFKISEYIRKKFKVLPDKGDEAITDNLSIKWNNGLVEVQNNKSNISFKSNNVKDLFFNAGWWELIVASEVAKWGKVKEVIIHCELPFKSDDKTLKNEIDILLNTGNKLIFVECKSGNIKQEDINKMKVIKQTYGGIISKSLLVSRFIPSQSILEKCKELDIEVYYVYAFKRMINPLRNIIKALDKLEKKTSI